MSSLHLRLPATSANLGAAFDTAAIALTAYLSIEAEAADVFRIEASGRNPEQCGQIENNLIFETYKSLMTREGKIPVPLAIRMENGIPLGMGMGSSAAGRLAAIAMATHFGGLGWSSERILAEACALEGHPDNAAACWLGGLVVASEFGGGLHYVRVEAPKAWKALVVLPGKPLATSEARAVLPEQYSRADVVANVQAASLLGLAFAQARADLLPAAMADRVHQPYRASICALLPKLLPLAGRGGIHGVALSGAGPAVILVIDAAAEPEARETLKAALMGEEAEVLAVNFALSGGGFE
ncbi:homoserine kinase [Acidicapsa dinghuensis]|uniref:Homoserine kinase n=1 Tax=Acidicapsa dinghuensis TaxID=2218256 RepID=A0ABW1EHX2_9BACT|nr:homoserine kinase [Acidicapsa dinghuensis]